MIELSTEYWDCECERDYIHSNDVSRCPRCGAMRDDQPPSRINEILASGLTLTAREAATASREAAPERK